MALLTAQQRKSFRDDGFLTISGFFHQNEINTAVAAYDRVWREQPPDVVIDSEVTGRRIRATHMTEEERRQPFKVNDLYLGDDDLRQTLLHPARQRHP